MSLSEYYTLGKGLFDAYGEGAERAEAARLLDQQLTAALGSQQPAAPLALGALGSPVATAPRPPSFASAGGDFGSYLDTVRGKESGGNAFAKNPNSTATGIDQFTGQTWAGLMRKYPQLGLTPNGRTDPEQSTRAMEAFTRDNANALSKAGVPVTPGNLYVSHFLGEAGGPRFIAGAMSNPDAPATAFVTPGAAAANRTIFYNRDGSPKRAADVYAERTSRFGGDAVPTRIASAGGIPSMSMPAPAPMQVAQAEPDAADMPTPNARPVGFQIPGQAPQSDFVPGTVASPPLQSASVAPMAGGLAPAAAQRLSPDQVTNLRAMLRNPSTQGYAAKIIEGLNKPSEFSFQVVGDQLVRTSKDGRAEVVPNITKPPTYSVTKGSDGNDYVFNPQTGGLTRAIKGDEKQFTDLTDPAERAAANVPDWYKGPVQRGPNNEMRFPGVGQQGVTPQQQTMNEVEKKLALDEADKVLAARNAVEHASQKLQTFSVLTNAWDKGNGSIYTGPGAETVLKAKQAAKAFGIDLGGVPETEIVQKVGTQLAAQTAKDLTSRPTQFDFQVMLQNNPGLLISEAGNRALINIGQQQAKRELQLSRLARQWRPGQDWGAVVEKFEHDNPIVSPLNGRPLDPNQVIDPKFGADAVQPPVARQGGQLRPMADDLRAEARAAIQAGKPAAAVMQRLRERGFDPAGL